MNRACVTLSLSLTLLCVGPSVANAAPHPFTGTLVLDIGTIAPITIQADGEVNVSPIDGSFTLPAGEFTFVGIVTPPQTISENFASVELDFSNGAGAFGGTSNPGGVMPLVGTARGHLQPAFGFGTVVVSLSPIGSGGTTVDQVTNGTATATISLIGQ